MKTFEYTITDAQGIHARPAGLLVKAAGKFTSQIVIHANGKEGDAKRLFALMGMGVKCGDTIAVTIEGTDEEQAAAEIENFLKANL